MPYVSVRERIIRQVVLDVQAEFSADIGASNIQRFKGEDNKPVPKTSGGSDVPPYFITITAGNEDVDNEETSVGYTAKMMELIVDAHILSVPSGREIDEYANEIVARIERGVMSNPEVAQDVGGAQLANEMYVEECYYPAGFDRQRDNLAGVMFIILYDHAEADPSDGREV